MIQRWKDFVFLSKWNDIQAQSITMSLLNWPYALECMVKHSVILWQHNHEQSVNQWKYVSCENDALDLYLTKFDVNLNFIKV